MVFPLQIMEIEHCKDISTHHITTLIHDCPRTDPPPRQRHVALYYLLGEDVHEGVDHLLGMAGRQAESGCQFKQETIYLMKFYSSVKFST